MTEQSDEGGEFREFQVTLDRAGRGPAGHPTRADIQLLSPDLYADPDERFAWMRANAPVYWDDATGIWGLASHEAVRIAAREWQTFSSAQGLAARQLGAEHDQHGRTAALVPPGHRQGRLHGPPGGRQRAVPAGQGRTAARHASPSAASATSSPTSPPRCRCT